MPSQSHAPPSQQLQRFLYKPWGLQGYFQFDIIINGLVSSFRFIYDSTVIINVLLFQCRDRLYILTSKVCPRAERVNVVDSPVGKQFQWPTVVLTHYVEEKEGNSIDS